MRLGHLCPLGASLCLSACLGTGLKGLTALQPSGSSADTVPLAKTCPQALTVAPYKTDFRYQQMSVSGASRALLQSLLGVTGSGDSELPAGQALALGVDRACLVSGLDTFVREQAGLLTFDDLERFHRAKSRRLVLRARLARTASILELEDRARRWPCVSWVSDNSEATRSRVETYFTPNSGRNPYVTNQKYVGQLEAAEAFEYFYHPVKGITAPVVIGVVDSGIRSTHVEFTRDAKNAAGSFGTRDVLWKQPGTQLIGYNAFDPARSAEDRTQLGHGTRVAGVIAMGHDNEAGGAGLVLRHVQIMPLQFIEATAEDPKGTGGYSADRQAVLEMGIDSGVLDVLNLSFAGSSPQQSFLAELQNATRNRIFVAASSGNEAADLATTPSYPAAWAKDVAGLMSVGGTSEDDPDRRWYVEEDGEKWGANVSAAHVEIAAPAEQVFTTASYVNGQLTNSGYTWSDGTSFSAPMVSAAGALIIGMLKTHGIEYSAALVEEIIVEGSRRSTQLEPYFREGRRLSLLGVVEVLKRRYPQTDPDVATTDMPIAASTSTSGAKVAAPGSACP